MVASPVSILESRSERLVVGLWFGIAVLLVGVDTLAETRLFSRYWPLIGVLLGLAMLATHRVLAPDEW